MWYARRINVACPPTLDANVLTLTRLADYFQTERLVAHVPLSLRPCGSCGLYKHSECLQRTTDQARVYRVWAQVFRGQARVYGDMAWLYQGQASTRARRVPMGQGNEWQGPGTRLQGQKH